MWVYIQNLLVYTFILGSIYLLVALGFSIICGVLRIFHLGYAYIFPLTVYTTWMFLTDFGWGLIPSIFGMVAVQFVIAFLIYKGIIKRYLDKELEMLVGLLLLTTIIEQTINYKYPMQTGVYLQTELIKGTTQIGSVVVSTQLLVGSIIALFLTAIFVLFFLKTRTGLAIRAISQNIYSSQIVGINVETLYVFTMMLVLVPVMIGTLIIAPVWTVDPFMGQIYMFTAILVAVLGGLGNMRGTIIASFLIGAVHAVMCFILGEPRFMTLSALVLVMIVLVVRPQGLTRSESLW
ncbi:MAG: branched-chain amino acid ABC transporter permease [Smithellaceae bacterium]|jgi:branched-chain amino acid transport system permease protein|nr:branched-chain amino acid ABC transporter permease [Syntrophaceae bacterium]NMD05982.1 branched-chain amino acid ABC transporter permease [Deltaproteobacteria bacterium]HNQ18529.1 branched-chain amino acid ABC transporter permease [Smithellaceae bacterium]HNT91274.1 branched-chain amino acid ABC transporter permease [Smithellaceae bacterium]HNV64742.1 branched-chain amino acid ABC transporter permease [Smithellaceae bacterium]